MFVVSKQRCHLSNDVYEFMSKLYPNLTTVDIEVIPTDLTEDNVFGWTLINNDQNVRGLFDDEQRENEAYRLERKLYDQFISEVPANV